MKKLLLILIALPMIGFGQIHFYLDVNSGITDSVGYNAQIATSDVDNDGHQDVLITSSSFSNLFYNNASGGFNLSGQNGIFPLAQNWNGSIAFSDIDNDGHQDILMTGNKDANGNLLTEIYRNDATSAFYLHNGTPFSGVENSSVAFADIDNDGDEDLLITGDVGANDFIGLYKNDGVGNFTQFGGFNDYIPESCGLIGGDVGFLDFDGDADLDLIVTGFTYSCLYSMAAGTINGAVTILYENDGLGNFTPALSQPFQQSMESSLAIADIDGDQDMDVIISGDDGAMTSSINIYINDSGIFQSLSHSITGVQNGDIILADLDVDGDQDLIISGDDGMGQNQTLVYSNDGTGNFTEVQNLNLVAPSNPDLVSVDIDGDADLDLIIVGNNSTSVYINAPAVYGCTDSLADNFNSLANIEDSTCYYGKTYVPDDNFELYLESEGLGDGFLNDSVFTANIKDEGTLYLSSMNISDLTGVEDFTSLEFLYCDDNNLTSLDVSQNTALETLYCINNNLTILDVTANTALNDLYCSGIQLLSLDVSQNLALTNLICDDNNLTTLDVSQNLALTNLNCDYNNLTTLDVSNNTDLESLDCKNNNITSLDVSNNINLMSFSCGNNQLTSLDVSIFDAFDFYLSTESNPNLYCIDVNNELFALLEWGGSVDSTTTFSTNCSIQPNGCTFSLACNYDSLATINDGSCILPDGCTDTLACNYDPTATCDDGSCNYPVTVYTSDIACAPYGWAAWAGTSAYPYWQSGIYTTGTHFTTIHGCDSTIILDLTINNSPTTIETHVACDSFTWIQNGVTYYNSQIDSVNYTNQYSCDSTVTLDLTINNSTSSTDTHVACDEFMWNCDGNLYTASNNTATYTYTNAAGCDSTVTLDLTINNSTTSIDPQIACDSYTWIDGVTYTTSNNSATWITTNAAGCSNIETLNLTINNSTTSISNVTACDNYTWNGTTYSQIGVGVYTYSTTASTGCDSTATLYLTIYPLPIALISGSTAICEGDITTIDFTFPNGTPPYNVNWTINGTATNIIFNNTVYSMIVSPNITTTYALVDITDANGCSAALNGSITVTVNDLPLFTISSENVGCYNQNNGNATAIITSASWPVNYAWSNGQTTQTANGLGVGTYECIVTDVNGCANIQSVSIDNPYLVDSMTNNILTTNESCNGAADGSIDFTVSGGAPPYTFLWSNGQITEDLENLPTGDYWITVTDSNLCGITDSVTIGLSFNDCFFIPTAFTPNGDAIHDHWNIDGIDLFTDISVKIFNRWGQLLFESVGYAQRWDGTYEGKELPTAAYYYIITLNNGSEAYKGTVTIKR